ncbi:UNVERIFIED_CONTAM: hypothetical protein Sindi_0979300 [Sesamum indicum]
MANLDNGSYEENSSLSVVAGPTIPHASLTLGAANAPIPNLTLGVVNAAAPALDQIAGPRSRTLSPAGKRWKTSKIDKHLLTSRQVAKETMPTEHGIPYIKDIMEEDLPTHFRAPFHLPGYNSSTDPAERMRKFENAVLL